MFRIVRPFYLYSISYADSLLCTKPRFRTLNPCRLKISHSQDHVDKVQCSLNMLVAAFFSVTQWGKGVGDTESHLLDSPVLTVEFFSQHAGRLT